jgi:glycine betaine/proline transport system substrate-binding protein
VLALASIVLIALGLLAACGGAGDGDDSTTAPAESTKSADLVYVNWAEGVAYTHLAKVVLEDKLGYEVEITAADVGPAYVAVAQGDKDAFMETWLPVLHKDYIDKYRDSVIDLGHVYENTQSGLVVPTYVTIDTISELDAHADKFDGKITGIDAGAGIMKTTAQVIEDYGLGLELMSSSGPAMAAALQEAVANEEWIVVTGWRPHWMFGRWDLKFLEQDKDKTIWGTGNIHIMGRKGLREDKPELAAFLSNMYLTDPQLADLMLKIKESDEDIETVARAWMAENEDVISDWMPSGA